MVDRAKACTEAMIPLRVMKVPKRTRTKVRMMRTMFQTLSIPVRP